MMIPQQKKEADAQYILARLGLDWDALKGKKILDIGEGSPELREVAESKGITVIPLPIESGDIEFSYPDKSFDIIISFALFPGAFPNTNTVALIFREAQRVLINGGEFRFGPGNVYFGDETDVPLSSHETNEEKEDRMKGMYDRSLAFLQTLNKGIEVVVIPGEDPKLYFYHYFISRK